MIMGIYYLCFTKPYAQSKRKLVKQIRTHFINEHKNLDMPKFIKQSGTS